MNRVVHFEIQATNIELLKDFYATIFGWRFEKWGEQDYWMIYTGEASEPGINGGLQPRNARIEGMGVNAYVCTIDVADLDATLAQVLAKGGKIALEKQEIPTMGFLAYAFDPDGNIFGMMQATSGS